MYRLRTLLPQSLCLTTARSTPFDGELEDDFEVTCSMGEGAADPRFEAGLLGGHEAAGREPGSEQPVERAHLQIDRAANFDLRYGMKSIARLTGAT